MGLPPGRRVSSFTIPPQLSNAESEVIIQLPEDAGEFVRNWVKQISEAAGGKTTIVTESGWPHQGDPNNKAIPSPENQAAAVASLKAAFSGGSNLVLYNSYNDLWKSDSAGTFGSVLLSAIP